MGPDQTVATPPASRKRGQIKPSSRGPFKLSQPPGWIPAHTACSATMSGPCYDIPVSQARSAEDLLKWSAQLLDKGWLYYTDWSDVLRDAAKGTVA